MIDTGVRHSHRRIYRLIGRDLYSTQAGGPLGEQEYVVVRQGVLGEGQEAEQWRVVVHEGRVCLDR